MTDSPEPTTLAVALLGEAVRKGPVGWVDTGDGAPRAVWWLWHGDAVALVTGGLEQPDPGLADGASVVAVARSKETAARVVSLRCRVVHVAPTDEHWDDVAAALHTKRLNAPDGEAALTRWRETSDVWLLVPTADAVEEPGRMSDDAHRAEPVPTDATSRTPQPLALHRTPPRRR
jgi:hypothetical protein